jgi:hypothetical protein
MLDLNVLSAATDCGKDVLNLLAVEVIRVGEGCQAMARFEVHFQHRILYNSVLMEFLS